jgi:hypothetical protein
MTARESDIRASANAVDTCPSDITGVSLDTCSVITNAAKADISSRIYGIPPTYTVTDETLPSGLQTKVDSCVDGVCNYVSYDFDTDTGQTFASLPYIINTRTTTTENSAIILKKRNIQLSSLVSQGTDTLVTTAAAHNFTVGGTVSLSVTPFTGEFVIKSIPSSTTFTYENKTYMIPGQPITTSTNVSYTPPRPVELNAPSGYDFNALAIVGNQIGSTISYATETTCAQVCDNNSSCVGFNYSSVGDTCRMFSSVTSSVITSEASFRKEDLTSNSGRAYIPENTNTSSGCADTNKCNDTMLKAINQGVSFSTTNMSDCANCSPRTFKKQGASFYVRNEFGTLKILNTITDAFSKISYSGDIIPLHVSLIQTYNDNFKMVDFNTENILFSFKFAPPMTSRNGVNSYYTYYNGTGLTGLIYLNGTYITYQPGDNSSYKNSWYRLVEVPDVKNGYFIKGLQETYSPSGVLTSRNDDYYFKYNNGFYADVNTPDMYSPYSDEYGSFVFVIRSSCQPGYLFHFTRGCKICPENYYCPSGTIGNQMMIHCPYGTLSPTGSEDKSQCVSCPVGDPGTTPTYNYWGRCSVSACTVFDPNASSASPDTSGVCRVICKSGYVRNSSGVCTPCSVYAPPGDPGTTPTYSSSGCTVSVCTTTDPHASSASPDTSGACRVICKSGYVRNSSGVCTPCSVYALPGDPGTHGTYSDTCTLTGCTTTDPHASSANIDASGACRNTCRYQKASSGSCIPCPVSLNGDPGTTPTYSTSGCAVSGCTTTALDAYGASPDASGVCRNICMPGFQNASSGSCIPCPVVSGDPGTAPTYSTSGCTVSGCTTTALDAYGASPDASGVCRNICMPGFQNASSGSCIPCPVVSGDPGTAPTYSEPGTCTPSSCTSTDPFATLGQEAYLDSNGACRNNCRNRYTRSSSGICTPCPTQNLNGDPYTSVSQNPDWISSGGSCTFLCIVTLAGGLTSASVGGATKDTDGNCRVRCNRGYRRTATGSCEVCPNSLPTGNDTGTSAYYKGFTGDIYSDDINNQSCTVQCLTTDVNASSASMDAAGVCRNTCKNGYQKSATGVCTVCTSVNGWGDAGTSVTSFSTGCTVSGCTTSDPNALGAGYTTFYTANGDCVNYCKTGFQRDFTNNQAGKCTACPTLTNTGGDTGTKLSYTASGTCSATGCTTTDPNASGAENLSNVCRNVCKPGFTRNSSGTCVTCTTLNDLGTTVTTYSSGCTASACTTTDVNASGVSPDASGVCRNTCKPGYTRNSSGACVPCTNTGDLGTTVTTYSSGCNASACTTTDVNASSVSPDASGACRNTCKSGYQKNSTGTCVACTNTGDSGTSPSTYISGCFASACTTTDVNASSVLPDTSGACRNVCKPGYKNSLGVCVACPKLRLVQILRDDTNSWNQYYFFVQYTGTANLVGRIIPMDNLMGKGGISYWKILTQTGVSFLSTWVTTYGLTSSSGTLCTVLPVDINGNETDTNPLISIYYSPRTGTTTTYNISYSINTDVPYCFFNYSNCPVGDAYTTATYSSGTCNILQCTTSDVNVASVASDGSACRNTCKTNFQKNMAGMCLLTQ